MKKLVLFISLFALILLCACSDISPDVQAWFISPSSSEISYDFGGVTGNATFTYYSENNNKIAFTSGDALSGVEFTVMDGKVTASRPDDGLEWETTPEMTNTLAVVGELYAYAAKQSYTKERVSTQGENQCIVNTFEYTDGSLEVTFSKDDYRPLSLVYTQADQTIKIEITNIKLIEQAKEEE